MSLLTAIISDVHANLAALRSVVDDAEKAGCQRFISLGDVVGYGGQPRECIDILRDVGAVHILGNHDLYVSSTEGCPRSSKVNRIIDLHRGLLSEDQILWLRALPTLLQEDDAMFVHGGPLDFTDQYLYKVGRSSLPDNVRWFFCGHTHIQFTHDFEDITFCNPGSVGQPRDGDPRSAYAIFDGAQIELRRVDYDIKSSVRAMTAIGIPATWSENLFMGTQIGGRIDRIIVDTE